MRKQCKCTCHISYHHNDKKLNILNLTACIRTFVKYSFKIYLSPLPNWKRGILLCNCGRSDYRPSDIRSISFDPFAWKMPNWVQWVPKKVDDSYWFTGHMPKIKVNCWSLKKCCPLNIPWPICRKLVKRSLVQWIPLNRWPLLIFRSHGQRSRSNCWTSDCL